MATKLSPHEISDLDPYKFMAVIGKRVTHPGGRASTEALLSRAQITASSRVLDVGCGVATTAIEIARRHGAQVTAADISPLMLELAEANVQAAGTGDLVTVISADILALPFAAAAFEVVIAEAVTMFTDRPQAAAELARVTRPGGRVLATEFYWRRPPTPRGQGGLSRPGLPRDVLRHGRGLDADLLERRAHRAGHPDRAVRNDDATRIPGG